MAGGGGNKKIFQHCTDPSGQEILYLQALQGHSRRSPIDLSLQDNVLIPNSFFEYFYHIGCAVNVRTIMISALIPGGQHLSKRQTVFFFVCGSYEQRTQKIRSGERQAVFFTAVNPMNKDHRDLQELDLTKPRLASHTQK